MKIKKIIHDKKGFATLGFLIGIVAIFGVVALFMQIVNLVSIKSDMDYMASELVKVIEYEGRVDSTFHTRFDELGQETGLDVDYRLNVNENTKLDYGTKVSLELSVVEDITSIEMLTFDDIDIVSNKSCLTTKYWK